MSRTIVFVLPSLVGGGAEFVTKMWAQEVAARGDRVEVVLLRSREGEPTIDGVSIKPLASAGAGRAGEMKALRDYLSSTKPDVAIGMMTRANFQLLSVVRSLPRRQRPKVVISERNIPFAEAHHSALHVFVRDTAYRRLYSKADAFIAISHPVGAVFQYAARLKRERVWVIPNPAIAKSGIELPADPAPVKGSVTLVVPARVVAKKRPLLAIEIADRLAADVDVSVQYFGVGELSDTVGAVERDYPIELMGRIENWFDHIPANGVVLLPSAVEGFGNVLPEAAARGVPSVVGSTAFGSADAIVPGVTGYFARADSVDEYVDAVRRAVELPRAAPEGWLHEFSAENSVELLLRLVDSLK
ncbi:glycosyltransferase [Herbiconiux sp. KACC 21604]|uniref:glycosyltransferase n=1 Tax=unclassified Herbiconiux TaxID=2618217 RepID=UPI0014918269|nr:glycosyltransferase [Herbiconiux sp. SALV-R1]QJU54583.1 glycosyltransferase [Herbiconiux sp. SALV-R1]WPO85669.1 glycosyltransferase [Herbiconiux sp. KACC 21604]